MKLSEGVLEVRSNLDDLETMVRATSDNVENIARDMGDNRGKV